LQKIYFAENLSFRPRVPTMQQIMRPQNVTGALVVFDASLPILVAVIKNIPKSQVAFNMIVASALSYKRNTKIIKEILGL